MPELFDTAREAAMAAGEVIRERMNQPRTVYEKAPKDIVTPTDHAAQAAAVDLIRSRFPDHHILAEEDPNMQPNERGEWRMPAGVTWIIDPVDGTSNYAAGLPIFCTSVGVAVDGIPEAGAIYDPTRDELFLVGRGQGAQFNGERVPSLAPTTLYQSLVSFDWAHTRGLGYNIRDVMGVVAPKARTSRVIGSAALAMSYIGTGRLQLYISLGLKPWDAAAAVLIAQEAGALAVEPSGKAWRLGVPTLLLGHPDVVDEAVKALQPLLNA